jgi:hypothetical protein
MVVETTKHNSPKQDLISNKKVFYNNNQIQHVTLRFKEPDEEEESRETVFILEYFPQEFDDLYPGENLSEMKIHEAQHFLEISFINTDNNMIRVKKIPYNIILEIDICTMDRKCKHEPERFNSYSESEKNSLK